MALVDNRNVDSSSPSLAKSKKNLLRQWFPSFKIIYLIQSNNRRFFYFKDDEYCNLNQSSLAILQFCDKWSVKSLKNNLNSSVKCFRWGRAAPDASKLIRVLTNLVIGEWSPILARVSGSGCEYSSRFVQGNKYESFSIGLKFMKRWVTAKFDYTDQGFNEQFSEYFDPKQILSLLLQCQWW